MKKFIFFSAVLALVVGLAACANSSVTKLREAASEFENHCPVSLGMTGAITGLTYNADANELVIDYLINESIIDLDVVRDNEEAILASIKAGMSKGEAAEMLQTMVDAGAAMKVTMKGNASGQVYSAFVSADEIKNLVENPMSDEDINKLMLKTNILIANAGCPQQIENGLTMTEVLFDGDNAIYVYNADENIYDISLIGENSVAIKENMRSIMADPGIKMFLGVLASLDKGLIYRYKGDPSGETADIIFTPSEVKQHSF